MVVVVVVVGACVVDVEVEVVDELEFVEDAGDWVDAATAGVARSSELGESTDFANSASGDTDTSALGATGVIDSSSEADPELIERATGGCVDEVVDDDDGEPAVGVAGDSSLVDADGASIAAGGAIEPELLSGVIGGSGMPSMLSSLAAATTSVSPVASAATGCSPPGASTAKAADAAGISLVSPSLSESTTCRAGS